jgi:aryl-alcohol dehydrogenase-like predicted oxidoreductase
MEYPRLKNTGLIMSRIAFGAMTFGAGSIHSVRKDEGLFHQGGHRNAA